MPALARALADRFDPVEALGASLLVVISAARREPEADPQDPPQQGVDREEVLRACEDRQRAERLLRNILPRVRNLVRYLVRDDHDVDDIAQEALVAVLRGLPSYRGSGRFESWVDRIVARVTFAELPRRRRAPARPGGREPNLALLPSPGPGVDDDFLRRRRVVSLLDRLPDAQRQVLVLHHVLELSVPEVARELRVPAETVRSRLRLGRKRFRELAGEAGNRNEKGLNDACATR